MEDDWGKWAYIGGYYGYVSHLKGTAVAGCTHKYQPNKSSIDLCIKERQALPDVTQYFKLYHDIDKKLETALTKISFRPVIYDEQEFFQDSNTYPF